MTFLFMVLNLSFFSLHFKKNFECQVGGSKFLIEFWWGGFYFRLCTYNVPSGSSDNPYGEARSAEFCVRKRILGFQFRGGFLPKKILENVLFGGWDGWDGMGYQKCPSIFFILCGYIDKVYTYLYR